MSKKQFKSQASSSRAGSATIGALGTDNFQGSFGASAAFGLVTSSSLSYVYEPPDLSGLSEPNIIVAFKSLQKRDGVTKSKALEDLQAHVSLLGTGGDRVEEAILEAWIKLYPRLSIDSARRVRKLAHDVQGLISALYGKRIAKYMPQIVGPWLAGMYDSDRSVARAAQESLNQIFGSPEKMKNLWRSYKTSIVRFATDAVTKETVYTLSDERTTKPDDAIAKYTRVAGASILMITNAIGELSSMNNDERQSLFGEFFNERKVWDLAADPDPFLRRAVYKLAVSGILAQKDLLDIRLMSVTMLNCGLSVDQTGSSYEYAKVLASLTAASPAIWTEFCKAIGKNLAIRKLCQYLKKGSLGSSTDYWAQVAILLKHVPLDIVVSDSEIEPGKDSEDTPVSLFPILKALHEGIVSKAEPRTNPFEAWNTYLDVLERLSASLTSINGRDHVARTWLIPLIRQYIRPSPDEAGWALLTTWNQDICIRSSRLLLRISKQSFEEASYQISDSLIGDLQTSLPEQANEYLKCHDLISSNFMRWHSLQASILQHEKLSFLPNLISRNVATELKVAVQVLRERSGKPYSAAILLQSAIKTLPGIVRHHEETMKTIVDFVDHDVPGLLLSPSASHLITMLWLLNGFIEVGSVCEAGINILRSSPNSNAKSTALQGLVSSEFLTQAAQTELLSAIIEESLDKALKGQESYWDVFLAGLSNPAAPEKLVNRLLTNLTIALSVEEEQSASLHGLELALKQDGQAVKSFAMSSDGSNLLSKLLFLIDSADEKTSQEAQSLSLAIEAVVSNEKEGNYAARSMINVINQGLHVTGPDSISVDLLVTQAQKLLCQANTPVLAADLLPDAVQWVRALTPVSRWPDPSTSVCVPLGSALSLIDRSNDAGVDTRSITHDLRGYSAAFRMLKYASDLLDIPSVKTHIAEDQYIVLCKNFALSYQIILHDFLVPRSSFLWAEYDTDLEDELQTLKHQLESQLDSWIQHDANHGFAFMKTVRDQLFNQSYGNTAASYYSACAFFYLRGKLFESDQNDTEEYYYHQISQFDSMRKSGDFIAAILVLATTTNFQALLKICNKLLADLTSHDFQNQPDEGLRQLVFLNSIINKRQKDENIIDKIHQQRHVFFIKHIVSQLRKGTLLKSIVIESLKIMHVVFPRIKDIYGGFWEQAFEVLQQVWSSQSRFCDDEELSLLHATLELLSTLRRLKTGDSNDDLQDAWAEKQNSLAQHLLKLLKQLQGNSDQLHKPRAVVYQLLLQHLESFTPEYSQEAIELYPILSSDSFTLRLASYKILQHHIPKAQDQVSIDKALENDYQAKLPQELLSLILTAPAWESLLADTGKVVSPALNTYILSWKLVFEHWNNSSVKVKNDYAICLKDGAYVESLLEFTFKILIGSKPKPVDASRFDLESYEPRSPAPETTQDERDIERDVHHSLINLYYLSLKLLPNLSRSWWRDTASRKTALAVEAWTEKYISPNLITSELRALTAWAPSQARAEHPLYLKTSTSTREITASIPLDEQHLQIALRLPSAYPLARAEIHSLHRVGVDEKKWRAWLVAAQGVMNFGDGGGEALMDGLLAWRRNATAALKGQAECAICYSVVGADRQLPGKRCGTCKNWFHGSCLFRWFKSSNSSSCPLCRNAFNYG